MKNIELNEIYSFKLIFGEEIVCKVLGVTDNSIVIKSPLSMSQTHNGIMLMPTLLTAEHDNNIEININSVVMFAKTVESIKAKYIEATTGIVTANKKLILG